MEREFEPFGPSPDDDPLGGPEADEATRAGIPPDEQRELGDTLTSDRLEPDDPAKIVESGEPI